MRLGYRAFLSVEPVPGGTDNPCVNVTNPIDAYDLDGRMGCGGWSWCKKARHQVHKYAVDLIATAPYGVYVGDRARRRTPWVRRDNWWLHATESLAIHSDMAIDRYKMRHHLGESSQYDEGPGSNVFFNPAHTLTKRLFGIARPSWHKAPGALERTRWPNPP